LQRFKFRLESVLRVREAVEQKLLGELADTRRVLEIHKNRLVSLQTQSHDTLRTAADLRQKQPEPHREGSLQRYVLALDEDIANQHAVIHEAELVVESKLAEVIKAMQDRKSLENIKEKHQEAHRLLELKEETKSLDDFASIRKSRTTVS